MNARPHRRHIPVALTLFAGVALAACSSTPGSSTGASAQASVGAGGSVEATAGPSASAASGSSVAVDLVFSGTLPFTAKGSAGQCMLGTSSADGSVVFAFSATEADYPGLGDGFYLNGDAASSKLSEKWLSSEVPSVGDLPEGSFTFSADHKSVTLDADLPGGIDKPEHLSGTIACP